MTFTMGQVVSREGRGSQETLFRCIRSMPSNPDWAYNSCYSAGGSPVGGAGGTRAEQGVSDPGGGGAWGRGSRGAGSLGGEADLRNGGQEAGKGLSWRREGRRQRVCATSLSSLLSRLSGVFHLHHGDVLSVTIPRGRAKLSLSPSGTFLGFVKL